MTTFNISPIIFEQVNLPFYFVVPPALELYTAEGNGHLEFKICRIFNSFTNLQYKEKYVSSCW